MSKVRRLYYVQLFGGISRPMAAILSATAALGIIYAPSLIMKMFSAVVVVGFWLLLAWLYSIDPLLIRNTLDYLFNQQKTYLAVAEETKNTKFRKYNKVFKP